MRLLAVDPGPEVSSFVVWDGKIVIGRGTIENENLILGTWGATHCAVEMIASYGMTVGASVFETCVWIGRFLQCWGAQVNCYRVFRKDVKIHMCGDSRAKDPNIRQAVIDRLGPPGTKKAPGLTYGLKGGEWQALALALTWWDQHHNNEPPLGECPF